LRAGNKIKLKKIVLLRTSELKGKNGNYTKLLRMANRFQVKKCNEFLK